MARIEIMSGTERRRRWSDEAKLRILAEADEPGARVILPVLTGLSGRIQAAIFSF